MDNTSVMKKTKKEDDFQIFFTDSIESSLFLYCACVNELSSSESDTIRELVKGRTSIEIARDRGISTKTVSVQKISAMKKMKIKSDIQLVHYFYFLQKKLRNYIRYI